MKRYLPHATLLFVALLAYGLLIPQLGFYWDDLPISWIAYQLGPAALTKYFSTNRPVWGLLYQITTRILPDLLASLRVDLALARRGDRVRHR
jgi:hypothetical protein